MEAILTGLGLNSTLPLHFLIFLITFLFLSQLIFKPYLRAFEERERRTVGSVDLAAQILEETESLRAEYQARAREINAEVMAVTEAAKQKALQAYQTEVQLAQRIHHEKLDQLKVRVGEAQKQALASVDQEVDAVSRAITDRLLGRNVHA